MRNIVVNGRQVRDILTDCWLAVLERNNPPHLFQREGKIVGLTTDRGEPKLDEVTPDKMYGEMVNSADFFRAGVTLVPAAPPQELAKTMVASPHQQLPIITGVSSVPTFLKDGRFWTTNGYCEELRIQFFGMESLDGVVLIPSPTEADVAAAVEWIKTEIYSDFPFAGPNELAHVFAALLLPFLRPLINGATPIHLIEANGPGNGKTLIAQVNTTIATGQVPGTIAPAGGEDEMRKRITGFLSEGHCNIILDNVNTELKGGVLASAITAPKWQDRPLYGKRIVTLPNVATWQVTANNVQLSLEIARRCLRIRIEGGERPWEREGKAYRHADLLEWVQANRKEIITRVHTIIRYWFNQGCPKSKRSLGSFEQWNHYIGGVIGACGLPGFLQNNTELYQESDPETQEWEEFALVWKEAHGDEWVSVSDLEITATSRECLMSTLGPGFDHARKIRLGMALAKRKDSYIGGARLVRRVDSIKKQPQYQLRYETQKRIEGL